MSAQAIVIIGATGDLAQHMLYPSLYFLDSEGHLPDDFRIIGGARSQLSDETFLGRVHEMVKERAEGYFKKEACDKCRHRLSYCVVDADQPASFQNLVPQLRGARELIFYLSTSPNLYEPISNNL